MIYLDESNTPFRLQKGVLGFYPDEVEILISTNSIFVPENIFSVWLDLMESIDISLKEYTVYQL